MSDWAKVRRTAIEGVKNRKTVEVEYEGETVEFTVRQLLDPEYFDVMSDINLEHLMDLQGDITQDEAERMLELIEIDDRTDEEESELEDLKAKAGDVNESFFDVVDDDTYQALRRCAMYVIVPDHEDVIEMFQDGQFVSYVEEEYGVEVKRPEDLYDPEKDIDPDKWAGPMKDEMRKTLNRMGRMQSFNIGLEVFMSTLEDMGN